jgi:anti-sigma factor RsiW
MNEESQIRLQAFLDGELPAGQAAEVRQWLERDREARELLAELQNTRAALAGHGADLKLPETREFFWSKIRREIERQERLETPREPVRKSFWARWGWRGLVPAGGFAAACLIALHLSGTSAEFAPELDLATDNMGAYTFRNQENGLTTVWFYDRTAGAQSAQASQPVTLASQ